MAFRVALMLVLLLPAAAAEPTDFRFWRDEAAPEYVLTADGLGAYSDGFWGSGSTFTNNGREWAFRLVDWPTNTVTFLPGDIEAALIVGGGTGEAGRASVGWELLYAGDVIASGATQTVTYAMETQTVTWSVAAPEGAYDLSQGDLVFRVYTSGHVGVGARMDLGPSTLSMPVPVPQPASDGPTMLFENLTGLPLEIALAFEEATTATRTYNWTHGGGLFDVHLGGSVENGSLAISVADAAGQQVFGGTLAELLATNQTSLQLEAPNGTWQIVLDIQDFVGEVLLHVQEGQPAAVDDPPVGDATNETVDDAPAPADKESPAPAAALLVGLVALALRRRR